MVQILLVGVEWSGVVFESSPLMFE